MKTRLRSNPEKKSQERLTLNDQYKCNWTDENGEECGKCFVTQIHVNRHRRNHSKFKFKCDICSKQFSRKEQIEKHMIMHSSNEVKKRQFQCDICLKDYLTKDAVKNHMIIHTGAKPFSCQSCSMAFVRPDLLKTHSRIHSVLVHTCNICLAEFSTNDELKMHMIICNAADIEILSSKDPAMVVRNSNVEEFRSGNKEKCVVCERSYSQKYLKTHMRTHEDGKTFTCKVCAESFQTRNQLHIHLQTHEHNCPVCPKAFKKRYAMLRHLAQHSTNYVDDVDCDTTSEKNQCLVCFKCYSRKDYLKTHMMTHPEVEQYTCEFCFKIFERQEALHKHLQKHSKEKYKCDRCSRGFPRLDSFKTHKLKHLGLKPYSCEVCSKAFDRKDNMQKHFQRHFRN